MDFYYITRASILIGLCLVTTIQISCYCLPTKADIATPNCDGDESSFVLNNNKEGEGIHQYKYVNNLVRNVRDTTTSNKKNKQQKGESINFKKECLLAHNKWRRQHGASDLKLDPKVKYSYLLLIYI